MSSTGLTYFKFDPNIGSKKSALNFNFKTIHAKATVDLAYRAKEGKEIVVTVKNGKKIRFRCFVETILYTFYKSRFPVKRKSPETSFEGFKVRLEVLGCEANEEQATGQATNYKEGMKSLDARRDLRQTSWSSQC
jgi:hypothetical protein